MVLTLQRCCCLTISDTSCSLVNRNDATDGGIVAAICAIASSAITPGPLGMLETRPRADAPYWTANRASSMLLMQQILMRGFFVTCTFFCLLSGRDKSGPYDRS